MKLAYRFDLYIPLKYNNGGDIEPEKLDLEYINNWSLWLDFKILLKTAWVVAKGTGR